jgi:hypothetical protein
MAPAPKLRASWHDELHRARVGFALRACHVSDPASGPTAASDNRSLDLMSTVASDAQ